MLRIVRIQPQFSGKGVLGHSPKRVLVWGPRRDARPAGERRSGGALEGCLSHRDSDPTWSKARDDAYAQKERLGGEPYRLCLCKRLRAADRRDETIAIVCASNPSVSQSADTSPYTGEALGWCDAEGEVKLYTDNPSVTAAPCHLLLHKGGFGLVRCRRRDEPIKSAIYGACTMRNAGV